jgi:SAM-dependent methyltransferase
MPAIVIEAMVATTLWPTAIKLAAGGSVLVILVVVLSEGKLLGKPLLRMVYGALAPLLAVNDRSRRWVDVCALLELGTARSLLDIGCGGGGLLACALSTAEGLQVTGLDWSQAVAANVRARLAPLGRFRVVVADVSQGLPFPDGSFDRVASFGVLPCATGASCWRRWIACWSRAGA